MNNRTDLELQIGTDQSGHEHANRTASMGGESTCPRPTWLQISASALVAIAQRVQPVTPVIVMCAGIAARLWRIKAAAHCSQSLLRWRMARHCRHAQPLHAHEQHRPIVTLMPFLCVVRTQSLVLLWPPVGPADLDSYLGPDGRPYERLCPWG